MRILFTCGGTAGHINPAVGVAGRIRELDPGAEILFVGAKGMMETELVPREGYEIKTVDITNIHRSLKPREIVHNLNTLRNVVVATGEAKKIISEFRPDVAVGTGGYVCYPVLRAAHAMGVPTLVHESNAVPGLTTRMLAGIVDCIMVGFEGAKENYKSGANVVFTGTPVRTDFRDADRRQAKARLGLDPDKPLVLSVWGSLGSAYMNRTMVEFIRTACEKREFALIHSAGKRGYPAMKAAIAETGCDCAGGSADVREYIFDMPRVMAAADLILCRSGASTLGELSALGRPAILIPSPNVTGNHQEKNARVLEKCGAAEVFLEGQFTAQSLFDEVERLLHDEQALKAMSEAMRKAGVPDATDRIAALVLGYVK